jgi:cytochrome c oxidase subunit 1
MILPGFGAISHIFAAFSSKRIFGYFAMVIATASIALLGFMVWAHHMFSIGMPPWLQTWFMIASLGIGVPTGIKVFSWLATMWGGNIRFTTPMLYALGFISLFVLGGFGGLILALVPVDYSLHDTYFVVGHFHYTLVGGSVMLLFASTFYWWPKMTGRMLNEVAGRTSFVFMFIGVMVTFGTMHVSGAMGMARRIGVYREEFIWLNQLTTAGYLMTAIAALIVFGALIASMLRKADAKDDPWEVNDIQQSFEWAISSPPPAYNFEHVPPIPVLDPMKHGHDEAKPAST